MKANINALLDKCEDPAKMIDQYLIDLKESLAEVKKETAGVMALEKQSVRQYEDNEAEITKYKDLAQKAATAGNDEDARTFIRKYKELEAKKTGLENNKNVATENASHMRAMHDKLVEDIQSLESRKAQIKSTIAIAKTTEKLTKLGDSSDQAAAVGNKFVDMEEKANRMLDEAQAKAELNRPAENAAESLAKKYAGASDTDVEEELKRLKG
jgi:phage shock protein A